MAERFGTNQNAMDELIGDSSWIRSIRETVDRVAPIHVTVVVTGETGTGKELVARRLHRMSDRSAAPFLPLNCAAIPDTLLESELFGFERGAFTGAAYRTDGILLKARGGTVFLDEIGELSSPAQAKLLRVLEDKEVRRLGSSRAQPVDVRFIAATNRSLESLVEEQRFRNDLLFRLNVVNIHVPPLRERPADIPKIAEYFLQKLVERYHSPEVRLSSGAIARLQEQVWPGNVRQLRNVIERTFALGTSDRITQNDLFLMHASPLDAPLLNTSQSRPDSPMQIAHASGDPVRVEASEMNRLRQALEATCWNKTKAAQMLSWSRMTVYRKISKYDLPSRLRFPAV